MLFACELVERKRAMRKKIRFFKQHTMETCGAACALMIADLYGKLKDPNRPEVPVYPTVRKEIEVYSKYRSHVRYPNSDERYPGMSGPMVARYLASRDLEVRLLHSREDMMGNRDGYYPESLFEDLYKEYCTCARNLEGLVQIATGVEINCDTLRRELDAGRHLILQTIVPGDADKIHDHVLHWIVVFGYRDDVFSVCDPLSSKIELTAKQMEGYMDTPIGRICIVVGEKA